MLAISFLYELVNHRKTIMMSVRNMLAVEFGTKKRKAFIHLLKGLNEVQIFAILFIS